ncbi:TPR repeat-containing protein-like protein [Leptotrombidium deliense]|uniref:4-hydroxyphenylpyruvate dioxygenase n=1 Tax=Leptotrombidium deliense TaxID=299467 RepID=A0A443SQU1_9ACAR|nr:TPR repeat-containing protein-like protein [Leptotrombidium deliense]
MKLNGVAAGDERNAGCVNFDHLTFWVGNAKQAVSYYCIHFGFQPYAYKGLENGSRNVVAHVLRQNSIYLVLVSALLPDNREIGEHLVKHGDGVKDIAFQVDDIDHVVERAKKRGASVEKDIWQESDDFGTVRMAVVRTLGDVTHTFVERKDYDGLFLPGFGPPLNQITLTKELQSPNLHFIDHVVSAQYENDMEDTMKWYENNLAFHRFWSVDDVNVVTEFSALKFVVVSNESESIKLNILEPAKGKRKSQVEEYLDYYGGPGVQHIAFHTTNIIETIEILRSRGVEFLNIPDTYYDKLRTRLQGAKVNVKQDLTVLEKLRILLDFDDNGYLLQIFTKPSYLDASQVGFNQRPLEEQFVNEFLARERSEKLNSLQGQNRFNMHTLLHELNSNHEPLVNLNAGICSQANEWAHEFQGKSLPHNQLEESAVNGAVIPFNQSLPAFHPEVKWAHEFLADTEHNLEIEHSRIDAIPVQSWINEYGQEKEFVEEARHFADLMKDDAEINGTEFMRFIKKVGNYGVDTATSNQWAEDFSTGKESVIKDDTDFWHSLAQSMDDTQIDDTVDGWLNDYNNLSDNTESIPNYSFAEENHLKDMENPFQEGLRKLEEGDIPSAVLLFEAACQKEPDNVLAWQYLGTTQAENEHDTAAIQALRECVALNGDNLTAIMALAVSYTNESMSVDAIKSLEEWISKNEKYSHFCERSGAIDLNTNSGYKEAFNRVTNAFIKAARVSPNTPDADVQCGLGVLFNLSGEYDKAADCFTAALQVRPRDALLWNRLGATLANGSKPEEAVPAYRRALELSPGFLRARFNLGISCVGLKAYQEAAEHFLTVLNHQNAGRGPKGQRSRTAMSNNVWSGLRLVMSLMGRQDLYPYMDKQDLSFLNKEFNI